MKFKILASAAVSLLLGTHTAFSQKTTYTLPDVWHRVLQHYPSLTARKEAIEVQALKKDLTRQAFLPDISVQAQHSYGSVKNIPGSFFPLPGLFTTTGGNKPQAAATAGANLNTSAVLQWNFLQFGRRQKAMEAADAAIDWSNAMLKQEEWKLLVAASKLYVATLATTAALEVAQADTRRFATLLELVQAQASAGLRPGADTLLLKASYLQSKAAEHDHIAERRKALEQLGALMGESSAAFSLDTTAFHQLAQTSISTSDAVQQHPYLQVLDKEIRGAEAGQALVKKEVYPTVSLLAGVGLKGSGIAADGTMHKNIGAPWRHASGTYLAGIGLTWNFSSLYQNRTKQAVANRTIAIAKAEKEAAAIELGAQYAAALSSWHEQQQKLAGALAARNASRAAYDLYEVRYQSGHISLIELLQLQKALQETERAYVTALQGNWNELLQQAETLGDPALILTAIKP
ncbi:TolC family protein [Paracnuella aquatica]|uniref:TolC family protein n=1 Tax=Paracnuella aquatica TaxID=2268757 RepID=UPI001390135A|nr:TolC family protein [Paracnuella aquatica]